MDQTGGRSQGPMAEPGSSRADVQTSGLQPSPENGGLVNAAFGEDMALPVATPMDMVQVRLLTFCFIIVKLFSVLH